MNLRNHHLTGQNSPNKNPGVQGVAKFSFEARRCGIEVKDDRRKAVKRFKEPRYDVCTLDTLLALDEEDLDELLAPLSMGLRARIKKGILEEHQERCRR